jgi:hypothetical protein
MQQLNLGPLVAMHAPNVNHARGDVHALPQGLPQLLSDPRLGYFLAQAKSKGLLVNLAAVRVEQRDADWMSAQWAPMLAPLGVRKVAVVLDDTLWWSARTPFGAASALGADRAGVEIRHFQLRQLTGSNDVVAWFDEASLLLSLSDYAAPPPPPAPRAPNEKLFEVPRVIDASLWKRANCAALAFLAPANGPPGLGFVFQDGEAGAAIFDAWRRAFGPRDENEVVRVAIIEGDIPNKPPGYTVTVGPDHEEIVRRAAAVDGLSIDVTGLGSWGRRMNTAPGGSPHLRSFKEMYAQRREYALVPVVMAGGGVEPLYDKQLLKRKLLLRDWRQIGPDDPDAPVLS